MRTNEIKKVVENMTVAEMRKAAGQYGIKNASKYKRVELQQMLVDAMVAKEAASKKTVKKATGKRAKAEKVENENIEALAKEMLEGIETLSEDQLMHTNRKVLIVVMKMLHCSKWYRTYDKATMIEKITQAIA